jgi:hypothetical protein
MLNKEKQLLCTFSGNNYKELIEKIKQFYTVVENKFFVFINLKNNKEYFITYNISSLNIENKKFPNTISIHRKKNYNTLYTLNGMNKLIVEENNGTFDKTFQLNWELYRNCLILTTDIGPKIVSLKLTEIVM